MEGPRRRRRPPPTPVPARARTVTRAPPRWAAFPTKPRCCARPSARNDWDRDSSAEKPRWGSTCLSTCPRSGAPRSTACPSPRATAAAAAAAGPKLRVVHARVRRSARASFRQFGFAGPRSGARVPPRPRAGKRARGGHGGPTRQRIRHVRARLPGAFVQTSPRANARNWSRRCRRTSKWSRSAARTGSVSCAQRDARALDRRFRARFARTPRRACAARSCGSRRACAPRWRPRWSARTTRARRRRGASATT